MTAQASATGTTSVSGTVTVSATPTVTLTVQGSALGTITDHLADTVDAHDASAISLLDTAGYLASSDAEGALAELGSIGIPLPAATGSDDTAAIQAVLTAHAGKVIKGRPGSSYIISAPLVIRSGTTLDMTGCTITLAANSNCNMLQNAGVTPTATATDGAITSGAAVLTTAAVGSAGQTVTVTSALASSGAPLTANVSSVGTGTLTLAKNAGATVTGATVKVFTRDTNITVRGGTWARGSNSGTGTGLHSLFFRHVDGLTLDIPAMTSSAGKFAISIASCTNVWVSARGLAVASDGVHLQGPLNHVRIEQIVGSTADDTFAITACDWTPYNDTAGDVTNVSVGRISATSTAASLCKVISSPNCLVDGISIGQIQGTAQLNGVWIGDDPAQATTTGGTYGGITIDTVKATPGTTSSLMYLASPNASVIRASLRAMSITGLLACVNIAGSSTATINLLDLKIDCDATAVSPDLSGAVFLNSSTTTIKKMVISDSRYKGNAASFVYVNAGTLTDLTVRDSYITYSGTTQFTVRHFAGTLSRVNFMGGFVEGAGNVFRKEGSGTTYLYLGDGFTAASCSRVADVRAGTTVVKLGHPHFDTLTNAAFFTNAGTYVFDGTISTNGSFTLLQRAASESVRCLSPELPVDINALAKTSGDMALNTAAATGTNPGAGVVICDGTTWRLAAIGAVKTGTATLVGGTVVVADTAITANSVIRLAYKTIGGAPGSVYVSARTAATSFAITSTSGTDTSVIQYDIITY